MSENKKKNPAIDLIIGLLVSLLSLFLVFFLLEIGLRVMGFTNKHLFPKEFISKDGEFHSLAPNINGKHSLPEFQVTFKTNSYGLRDKEYSEKNPDDFRILVLGDSFTMGWGVQMNEIFTEKLERKFESEKSFECKIEVLNAGVYGYGTVEELLYLEKKGLKLKPDLLLLTFFIGNDIFENMDSYRKFFDPQGKKYPRKKSLSVTMMRVIRKYSRCYSFLMARLRNMKSFRNFYNKQSILFDAGEPRDEIELYQLSRADSISKYWDVTRDIILQIKDICDENDIDMVLVTIPSKAQVYEEQWAEISEKLGIQDDSDIELPDKILQKLCQENGIHYFRLLDNLQKAGESDKSLYFKLDRHWKPACHELVGNYLYSHFIDENIIDCPQSEKAENE